MLQISFSLSGTSWSVNISLWSSLTSTFLLQYTPSITSVSVLWLKRTNWVSPPSRWVASVRTNWRQWAGTAKTGTQLCYTRLPAYPRSGAVWTTWTATTGALLRYSRECRYSRLHPQCNQPNVEQMNLYCLTQYSCQWSVKYFVKLIFVQLTIVMPNHVSYVSNEHLCQIAITY